MTFIQSNTIEVHFERLSVSICQVATLLTVYPGQQPSEVNPKAHWLIATFCWNCPPRKNSLKWSSVPTHRELKPMTVITCDVLVTPHGQWDELVHRCTAGADNDLVHGDDLCLPG